MSRLPTPWYWRGVTSQALRLLAALYRSAQHVRSQRRRCEPHELPLIIVGNPRVGGSGKTPISLDLVARLRAQGARAAWVGRGVGGTGYCGLISSEQTAQDVGDEAAMACARLGPDCFAGVPRSRLIAAAFQRGCAVVVSDDGMQSPDLRADQLVVVMRAEDPWGNGRRLPAGPLREGPECLERADLIVWHGLDLGAPELPAQADERWVSAWYELELPDLDRTQRIGLCTSIADPERFRRSVEAQGLPVDQLVTRADHRRLPLAALDRNLTWLTTEKDMARHHHELPAGLDLRVVGLRLCWGDPQGRVDQLLHRALKRDVDTEESSQ